MSDVESANKTRPEVAELLDENIEANDITIWIDPLDDAQDYVGTEFSIDWLINVTLPSG